MNIINAIKTRFTTPSTEQATFVPTEDASFILSKEEFLEFQTAFKTKARAKQTSASDILLYNIVRGKEMDRGFTPITNPRKLAGGENAYKGKRKLFESQSGLRWLLESFIRGSAPGQFLSQYKLTPIQAAKIVAKLKGE